MSRLSHRSRGTVAAAGVAVVLCGGCDLLPPAPPGTDQPRPEGSLSSAAVAELERTSAERPDALDPRVRLLTHYFLDRSEEGRKARARHALWIIAHAPESEVAGQPYAAFNRWMEPQNYGDARALWLEKVKDPGAAPVVLRNAARFFIGDDRPLAEELLLRGVALEPDEPEWRGDLGHLYSLDRQRLDGTIDPAAAAKALAHYEAALRLTNDDQRYYGLSDVADAAYHAGQAARAREAADELLRRAAERPRDWNFGNAIHDGHRILGHLELDAGHVDAAKRHLLDAGATPGSPQLDSFGPELTLAQALLDRGERDVVIEYLKLTSKFWKTRGAAVDRWIAEITAGGSPRLNRFDAGRD
jgi:hypothetical protein